jgi:hypothetical protein
VLLLVNVQTMSEHANAKFAVGARLSAPPDEPPPPQADNARIKNDAHPR